MQLVFQHCYSINYETSLIAELCLLKEYFLEFLRKKYTVEVNTICILYFASWKYVKCKNEENVFVNCCHPSFCRHPKRMLLIWLCRVSEILVSTLLHAIHDDHCQKRMKQVDKVMKLFKQYDDKHKHAIKYFRLFVKILV